MNRAMTFYQRVLSIVGILEKEKSYCMKQYHGEKYYRYRHQQGRWESCKGPFDTIEECELSAKGRNES